jgi:CheY-like chemotaxis protein
MALVRNVVLRERAFRPLMRAVRKAAITGKTCPVCGSTEVRRSARWGFLDAVLTCLFLAPFRCRVCRERFYRVWRPVFKKPAEPPRAPVLIMPRPLLEIDPLDYHLPEPSRIQPGSLLPRLVEPPPIADQPLRFTRPRSILILESDASIRRLLHRLLDRRGYFTHEVIQADDLTAELRERRVDLLIIADELNSLLAAAHDHPHLKILALSSDSLDGNEAPGRCLALAKPFASHMFLECVDRLLESEIQPDNGIAL